MTNENSYNLTSGQNVTGHDIYISSPNTSLAIETSNNKSRYFAELAESYKNKTKEYMESARYYSEQNSDVSRAYVDSLEVTLRNLINTKQAAGNYALSADIPTKVSDLDNDSNFLTTVPTATTSTLGLVKPDGTTLAIDNGMLSANVSVRNLGEIITSTVPLTDAGLHLLDGTLLSGSGVYSDFVDYIADLYDNGNYAAMFDTEANWQTNVATNGVCGKFVYDSVNNTVRLPKFGSKIYTGCSTAPIVGNGTALGFTDGTNNFGSSLGTANGVPVLRSIGDAYGAGVGDTASTSYTTYNKAIGITTDSTKSGLIVQLSNITTSLDGYYYIVVATFAKTDIQVDIDEIATDINGKADKDLSNISNTSGFRKLVEVYNNGASWYKIYSEYNPTTGAYVGKWCEQGSKALVAESLSGVYTITFLKTFKDTNYNITIALHSTGANSYCPNIRSITNNTMVVYNHSSYLGFWWRVSGYLAEGGV